MGSAATSKARAGQSAPRHAKAETGWRLLKIRDLRWLWTGQAISQIGEGLNKVALLYLVYNLTNSTLMTTVIGVLQTLPPLILGPLIGVYVDRFSKKWIMMGVDMLRAGLALIIPLLYAADALTLPRVYIVVFLMAVVATAFGPALSATVPLIVERAQLTATNALVASTAMIGMLVGPAVSGLGIATVGMQVVLYVSSATFVLSVLSLSRLHLKQSQSPQSQRRRAGSFVKDLKEGMRYVFVERRTIAGFVLTALCYSLASSAFVFLLPQFAEKVLHVGAMTLGWLWSAYGAGMVAVSIALASFKQQTPSIRLLMITGAMVIGGTASFLLAGTAQPLLSMGLVAMIGAGLAAFTPVVWGMLQELTPEKLRGRIFSIFNTGAMSASMIGMVAFGWATDRLGSQTSLLGMAAIFWLTAAATLLLWKFGDLSKLESEPSHRSRRPA
ncbi:MAG TPA: MFS transporter [Nitrospiraceae bacterium]|nr:MFS transporter [Nitrospiraceae bacterium]